MGHLLRPRRRIGKQLEWKCVNMHCGYLDFGSGTERVTNCPHNPGQDGANTPALEGLYDEEVRHRRHMFPWRQRD